MEIEKWSAHSRLEFRNQEFDQIFLNDCKAKTNLENYDFNTELYFENCSIRSFGLIMICTGKNIEFNNCRIEDISCEAAMFDGGFKMKDCKITGSVSFSAGIHNKAPNAFIMENCFFDQYVDFFDVQFDGPVKVTDNTFSKGTNLCIYLAPPLGIIEGQEVIIDGNSGDLSLYAIDDPLNPEKRRKN